MVLSPLRSSRPLAITLSAARPAPVGLDMTRASAAERHGCENTDNSPQSCIRITYPGHRLRAITVGGRRARAGRNLTAVNTTSGTPPGQSTSAQTPSPSRRTVATSTGTPSGGPATPITGPAGMPSQATQCADSAHLETRSPSAGLSPLGQPWRPVCASGRAVPAMPNSRGLCVPARLEPAFQRCEPPRPRSAGRPAGRLCHRAGPPASCPHRRPASAAHTLCSRRLAAAAARGPTGGPAWDKSATYARTSTKQD